MKKTILTSILALYTLALILPPLHFIIKYNHEMDVRANVVKLVSDKGSCSGTQIVAPSGKKYILTAGHCRALEENGKIGVIAEGMRKIDLAIVEESETTDLMLLEGHPQLPGLHIGSEPTSRTNLRAYTHGMGLDTYEANGKLIQTLHVEALDHMVNTPDEETQCTSKPKYAVRDITFLFFQVKACVLSIDTYVTTLTPIVPGSSGGSVVDGEKVVGVVVMVGGGFSYMIKHKEIKEFVAPY
jgi:hypothetical protein